ncbi:hypothetical protein SPURM210S_03752 [Streptomyces purpurascens]
MAGQTQVVALDRVSADFRQAEFTAIMGPSGSGKSTLMHCVAGLDSFSSGSVRIGDTELGSGYSSRPSCAGTRSASSSRRSICCRP